MAGKSKRIESDLSRWEAFPTPPPRPPGGCGRGENTHPCFLSCYPRALVDIFFFFWSPPEGPLRVYAAFSLETFADDVGAARPFQPRRGTGARCKGPGFSGSWRWLLHVCGADPRDPDGGARETRARTSWARRACCMNRAGRGARPIWAPGQRGGVREGPIKEEVPGPNLTSRTYARGGLITNPDLRRPFI